MQGIRDSIQQNNNKQNEGSIEKLINPLENMQINTSSVFDKPSLGERINYYAEDSDALCDVIIGTGVTGLAARKATIKTHNKLPENQVSKVNEAIDEVLNKRTNLGQKEVKIVNLTSMDAPELKDTPKFLKFLDQKRKIVKGKNAGFAMYTNEIFVNREKMALSTFHEIGHAYNFNNTKWKNILRFRPLLMAVAIGASFLPYFVEETWWKPKEKLTIGEKIKNGIHSAAPLITGAAFLPVLIEEGKASVNASKFAKQLLEKGVYKRMARGNIYGFATYLMSMLGLIAGAQLNKVSSDQL